MEERRQQIRIAYYSGTGGTEMIAQLMSERLKVDHDIALERITSELERRSSGEDLLILLFPVHAFHAPNVVYSWIKRLPDVQKVRAAVISVSGGGEISPNTACRIRAIKELTRKGYHINYENMLVMPSNWVVPTKKTLAILLMKILPHKVDQIIEDIMKQTARRTTPYLLDRLFSVIGLIEIPAARLWGKYIRVNKNCTGCSWCSKNCPSGNITMENERPCFHNWCEMCLKCLYGCPMNALKPGVCKFVLIKDGYNLHNLMGKTGINYANIDLEAETKGYAWSGVRKYLKVRKKRNI